MTIGSADRPAPEASTLFEIGSITEALTGVLLADSVLRGEVALDDRFRLTCPSCGRTQGITNPHRWS